MNEDVSSATEDKRMFVESFRQNADSVEYAADMQGIVAIYKSLIGAKDIDDSWDAEEVFEQAWDMFKSVKEIQGSGIHHMIPATQGI